MMRLKQVVTLNRRTGETKSEYGEAVPVYATAESLLCSVYPITNALEAKEYGKQPSQMRKVLTRWNANVGLNDKITLEGRTYIVREALSFSTHKELKIALEV